MSRRGTTALPSRGAGGVDPVWNHGGEGGVASAGDGLGGRGGGCALPGGRELGGGLEEEVGPAFAKAKFVYQEWEDRYRCPAGEKRHPVQKGSEKDKRYTRYGGAPCERCSLRSQCTSSPKGRTITRHGDEVIKDAARELMSHPLAQKALRLAAGAAGVCPSRLCSQPAAPGRPVFRCFFYVLRGSDRPF